MKAKPQHVPRDQHLAHLQDRLESARTFARQLGEWERLARCPIDKERHALRCREVELDAAWLQAEIESFEW